MTPVERVQALIAKALSTDSEEEARTCALTAVKIIIKDKLEVVTSAEVQMRDALTRAAVQRQTAAYRPAAPVRKRPADAPSRTSYDTSCVFCNANLTAGSKVYWSKVFKVMVCPDCFESEIMEKVK
jgi:hypothetical protein